MQQNDTEMPHIGAIIANFLEIRAITRTECAQKMGVTPSQISKYLQRYSLPAETLWKFCLRLEHNFFADLQRSLPVYETPPEDPRIREMQLQIDIYKDLLRR